MIQFHLRYQALLRRAGRSRMRTAALRALWLAALVPLAAATTSAVTGFAVPIAAMAAGAGMVFAVAVVATARKTRSSDPGRELDRRFGLDDLLVTAVEVDRRGAGSDLERQVLADAASTVDRLAYLGAGSDDGWRREAETLAAVLMLSVGAVLSVGSGADRPPARLPSLEIAAGGAGGGAAGPDSGSGDAAGTGTGTSRSGAGTALGDAAARLQDHASAGALAEALGRADAPAAARATRAMADQALENSESGRRELGEAMAAAGVSLADRDPSLSEALGAAGRALQGGDRDVEAAALDALAVVLERSTGGAPGVAPRPPRSRDRDVAAGRDVPAEASSLELPSSGRGETVVSGAAEGAPTHSDVADASAASSPRPAPSSVTRTGADSLAVPWPWRDTVRRYFDRGRVQR